MTTATRDITGNEYVSLPVVGRDGSIPGITALHAGLGGLIEWAGDGATPLFRLVLTLDGVELPLGAARWSRLDRWIPTFTVEADGDIVVTGTICAPGGYPSARGFLVRVEIAHGRPAPVTLEAALQVNWAAARLWVSTGRDLPGTRRLLRHDTGPLILDARDGQGPSLAVAGDDGTVVTAADQTAGGDEPLTATLSRTVTARPGARATVTFRVGAGRERDGAAAAVIAMQRRGAGELLRQARMDLSHTLRAAQDPRRAELLNRNLLFNRYFAVGRGIDDDRLWLLRSRSTLCPAPAVVNEREALFWTLPALLLADPALAREALLRCFDLFSERSGEHLRYMDGGAFDSAFVLEQMLLYPWALDQYVTATGDAGILDEPVVQHVVVENDTALFMRLHPEHVLAATELLPSGDPADHPWTTMGNALLRAFAAALPRLWPGNGGDPPPRFEGMAEEIGAAIWQHLVVPVDGEQVFAGSSALDGSAAVYDDPAMSLALLPYFGLCDEDDPVWTATMEFVRSPRYPLWSEGRVPGVCHRSTPGQASLAALMADMLGPHADDALDRLLRITLPDGVAAAGWDTADGTVAEPHHAGLAGLVAWTLARGARSTPDTRRPARR
ncbi:MAG TPA: glycoside hydrolase family 125 protein [Longimicrobiales bacterium]|nr:glycoside hydrolase family 125 protein [Longimicrobiales bacterium]